MVATSGTPKGRALAAAMRGARKKAGISVREMARRLGLPHSVVSYWETGKRVPKPEDVGSYLTAIHVIGDERARVLDLVRGATEPNWLTTGIPGMTEGLSGVLECERTAIGIIEWTPLVVPGLLQTSDYARAIFEAGKGPAALDMEARLLIRAGRKDIFNRSDPTQLHALLGEPALRAPIGGTRVLANQLRYLRKIATEDGPISIQVVPTELPWHPGVAGPFALYEFQDEATIVHLENHRSSVFLYDDSDIAEYLRSAHEIRDDFALSEEESLKLINEAIDRAEAKP